MSDFNVEFIGDKPGDIERRLSELGTEAQTRANRALAKTAQDIKDDLEETSPVDTGEYQQSWYILEVAEDEVWILNEADHAVHVMLPNRNMQGSEEADLPSIGILHNVKGVAREHNKGLRLNFKDALQDMIRAFSVK